MMKIDGPSAYYYGPNFESNWFKPLVFSIHQWKNLTSPIDRNKNNLGEFIKRMLCVIPLTLATLAACLISIPGFLTCQVIINNKSNVIVGSNLIGNAKVDLSGNELRAIELQTIGNLVVTYTEKDQRLEITGDDNLLCYLTCQITDHKLILGVQNGVAISTKNPITYHLYISHKALEGLIVSGSGSIQVERLETENFYCQISGQGTINIKEGHVNHQNVLISGQGHYKASNFHAENSHVSIPGQGEAYIHSKQLLDVKISGMGKCIYSGNPQKIQQDVSGMGRVKQT